MPINNALTPEGQNALGAAFGYYPQLRRNRTVQDPQAALDMPVQFLRGRLAATAGAPSDILNMLRSPMPMEMYGDVDYSPQTQVPYGSQELLKTLPLPPQGPAQQAAANLGALAPLTPMEALQAARAARQAALVTGRAFGPSAAGMAEGYLQRQGLIKNIFVGENSKTWNKSNAAKAVEMEKSGAAPEDIWATTGTFRGPDKKWRQEISDKNLSATDYRNTGGAIVLKHPELRAAYEQLPTGVKVKPDKSLVETSAYKAPADDLAWRMGEGGELYVPADGKVPLDVYAHELQHAVQSREGFARGGSPEMFKPHPVFTSQALEDSAIIDKIMRSGNLDQYEAKQRFETLFKREPSAGAFAALERVGTGKKLEAARDAARLSGNPIESYMRLAGEAEARAVQSRMNMTPQERLATFPYESYDVPINQLIVRTR